MSAKIQATNSYNAADQLLGVAGREMAMMYELAEVLQKNSALSTEQTNDSLKAYVKTMLQSASEAKEATLNEATKLMQSAVQSFVSGGIGIAQGAGSFVAAKALNNTGSELNQLTETDKALKEHIGAGQDDPAAPGAAAAPENAQLARLKAGIFTEETTAEVENLSPNEARRVQTLLQTEMSGANTRQQLAIQHIGSLREVFQQVTNVCDSANKGTVGILQQNETTEQAGHQAAQKQDEAAGGVLNTAMQANAANTRSQQEQRSSLMRDVFAAIRDSSRV